MAFFKIPCTAEELKKQYRDLVKKHHPDKGGEEQKFKALQSEYCEIIAQKLYEGEPKDQSFKNVSKALSDKLRELLNIANQDFDIEVIGSWIWVAKTSKEFAPALKDLGFRWHRKKKLWFWAKEYKKVKGKSISQDEIRAKYGSKKYDPMADYVKGLRLQA